MAAAQLLCYFLPRLFLPQLTLRSMALALDARIPFSPPWIVVYVLAYPFWLLCGLRIVRAEKPHAYRMTAAYVLAMLLSAAAFLLWPATMERPAVTGRDVFSGLVRLVYRADSPTNLFPSLHVLITYFCWRGTMRESGVSPRFRKICFACFLLVSCAVVLVKQHVLADIPAGVLAGELALQCARVFRLERIGFSLEHLFRKERTSP